MVLSAYYEPQFSNASHGFRPGRGCHTALQSILQTWRGTKWFIEGDIKGCFDHIDHDKLLGVISAGDLANWATRSQHLEIQNLTRYIAGQYPA